MAIPTVYKWTDAGAPTLVRNSESSLLGVIQACLVDGYGSKTGAGWTIPFSDATSFVVKQGGTKSVKACFKIFGKVNFQLFSYEAAENYTDLNTPVNIFESGVYIRVPNGYSTNDTYPIPWIIIATARAVYFNFGRNTLTASVPQIFDSVQSSTALYNYHWFFGDYVSRLPSFTNNIISCVYNNSNGTDTNFARTLAYSPANDSLARWRSLSTFSDLIGSFRVYKMYLRGQDAGADATAGATLNDAHHPIYPNALDGSLYLDKIHLLIDKTHMGFMPGMLIPIHSNPFPITGNPYSFTGTDDYAGEDLYVFHEVGGGCWLIRTGVDWGVE